VARDLVGRNVAMLVDTPKGQAGRPSKSLTLEQASALLAAAEGTRMRAYVALCLATGIRTEEARALRWEHVDLGDPDGSPPVPASAAVWRSVRAHGGYQDGKVAKDAWPPRDGGRCAPGPSEAAGRGTARRWSGVERQAEVPVGAFCRSYGAGGVRAWHDVRLIRVFGPLLCRLLAPCPSRSPRRAS
jgi:hypothetical protein